MNTSRRSLLKSASAFGILLAAGVITSKQAFAADIRAGFDAKSLSEALTVLGGTAVDSKDIAITTPDIAENA